MGLLARARRSEGGHYARKLETALGEVKLRIPRDREEEYYSSLLTKHPRRTAGLSDPVLVLDTSGVSDRKVAEVLGLLFGYPCSHEAIRNLTELVQEEVKAFRLRPLPRRL